MIDDANGFKVVASLLREDESDLFLIPSFPHLQSFSTSIIHLISVVFYRRNISNLILPQPALTRLYRIASHRSSCQLPTQRFKRRHEKTRSRSKKDFTKTSHDWDNEKKRGGYRSVSSIIKQAHISEPPLEVIRSFSRTDNWVHCWHFQSCDFDANDIQ